MTKRDTTQRITTDPRRVFATNLRSAMALKEMSVNGLVDAMRPHMTVDDRVVKRWRAGTTAPRLETIFLLAYVLDVTPGWFFDNRPAPDLAVAA